MSDAPIEVTITERIMSIMIARPEKKNALTPPMYSAMTDAFRRADDDGAVRVVTLMGKGGTFTAGNDLLDFMNTPPAGPDSPVIQFLLALASFKKPLVVGVQGAAIGIGTTLLPHADVVYADETARFQMPFVNLGLCPEGASSLLLPRIMGPARATALLMFGDKFDAEHAKTCGLLTDILPHEGFAERVRERALVLAEKPPVSLRLTKELLRRATKKAVEETFVEEGGRFLQQLASEEAAEAFGAFMEKRKPDFSRFS
jgi:enoyl-CoA hydratase/carnithine racemase